LDDGILEMYNKYVELYHMIKHSL